jgi:hypothetical protein
MFFDRVVMGLWLTQGDERRLLFSNCSPWTRRPPLCHLDRSAAKWRDLRFSGPLSVMFFDRAERSGFAEACWMFDFFEGAQWVKTKSRALTGSWQEKRLSFGKAVLLHVTLPPNERFYILGTSCLTAKSVNFSFATKASFWSSVTASTTTALPLRTARFSVLRPLVGLAS